MVTDSQGFTQDIRFDYATVLESHDQDDEDDLPF